MGNIFEKYSMADLVNGLQLNPDPNTSKDIMERDSGPSYNLETLDPRCIKTQGINHMKETYIVAIIILEEE